MAQTTRRTTALGTWFFNEEITVFDDYTMQSDYYEVNFTSNDYIYIGINDGTYAGSDGNVTYVSYDNPDSPFMPTWGGDKVYDYDGDGKKWFDEAYRTIAIVGGDDVENASLIAWLEANAVFVPEKSVNKVVYGGNAIIDLTTDTVTADSLLKGVTAHRADGSAVVGTIPLYDGTIVVS